MSVCAFNKSMLRLIRVCCLFSRQEKINCTNCDRNHMSPCLKSINYLSRYDNAYITCANYAY